MRGRKEPCKNSLGGIRRVYFMDYKYYPPIRIELNEEKTELISFPVTIIYEFEQRADGSFDQNLTNDEGVIYEQTLEVPLKKDSVTTLREIRLLSRKELRVIIEDSLGNLFLMGLYNGVNITDYTRETGGSKSDFNGYNLKMEARENMPAPFLRSLEGTGFIPPLENKTLWLASDDTILASNDTKKISELYL